MKTMKNVARICVLLFIVMACNKNKNREYGFCYCDFANGKTQQYDLTNLSRQDQIDQCNTHDKNAANFGGHCKLE